MVWVGGIALVFGGFFLMRYSIEQGWFGPGMRVILGGVLALALIAAGEWTRRTEIHTSVTGLPAAQIPSILTAEGMAISYADVYAAYALYDFIGPAVAFMLLGLVALAAALLDGPELAGLGLVGAFVTPLIVSTEQPNCWALYIFILRSSRRPPSRLPAHACGAGSSSQPWCFVRYGRCLPAGATASTFWRRTSSTLWLASCWSRR